MRKKKNEKITQYLEWIISAAVLFVYFLIILLSYSNQMLGEAGKAAQIEIEDHCNNILVAFENNIIMTKQAVETATMVMNGSEDMSSDESIHTMMEAVESSPASYGFISNCLGDAVDSNGTELNVWEDPYFAKAVTGVTVVSDIEITDEYPDGVVSIYAPVKSGNLISGIMCLQYTMDHFLKYTKTSDHDGSTLYALMKTDGTLVSISGPHKPEAGTVIYDVMGVYEKTTADSLRKKLKQDIENAKDGSMFCNVAGVDRYIEYEKFSVGEWYMIELCTKSYFDRVVKRDYKPTQRVMVKMMVALFLFFAIVILIAFLNRTIYKKKNEELQSKAETDLLTGLLNKVATEKHIQYYLENEGRDSTGMLLVLDIDNFKKINDTMGHAFGDQVLSTLGIRLRNQFRVSDIIGRIGGDEFIVFLKNINDDAAKDREAKRIVEFFKDFRAGDYVKYSATASIGAAMYPKDGQSFMELYKAADKGVYRAKQQGKNQLAFYEDTL